MIIQKGRRNTALVYADKIDKVTKMQIAELLRNKAYADCKFCFMPDVHAGRYVPVGTTMSVCGRLCPTMLGSDIGCGIDVTVIRKKDIDLVALDTAVQTLIPCGAKIHTNPIKDINLNQLFCRADLDASRAMRSIGTLGGGNHFIELDRCLDGTLLLVVHTGSRQLGSDVMRYYLKAAYKQACKEQRKQTRIERNEDEYSAYSKRTREQFKPIKQQYAVMEGDLLIQYLHDIAIINAFAELNRRTIAEVICNAMHFDVLEHFSCVHNYIDTEHMILRKGAISARQGERVVIPLNMRDGVILGVGKVTPNGISLRRMGQGAFATDKMRNMLFLSKSFKKKWGKSIRQQPMRAHLMNVRWRISTRTEFCHFYQIRSM